MSLNQRATSTRNRLENRPVVPRLVHPGSESSREEIARQAAIDRRNRAKNWITQARGQVAVTSPGDGSEAVANTAQQHAATTPAVESKSETVNASPESKPIRLPARRLAVLNRADCGGKLL